MTHQDKDNSVIIQEVMANAQRYNDWIYRQFRSTMGRRILDVGCSIGNLTEKYIDREKILAFEVVEESVFRVRERFKDKTQFSVHHMGIENPSVPTISKADLDTAICINVLEHVENHLKALHNMSALMVPGAWLNLFVPAGPGIFGSMDRTDGHFRRYTKKTLRAVLEEAGFEIRKLYYFNLLGYFGWWYAGKIKKQKFVDIKSIGLMEKLVPFLSFCENLIHPPFGQSLVCIAKKK